MPQQHPSRASVHRHPRARRTPRLHTLTAGVAAVAAAALTATTSLPATVPAAPSAARAATDPRAGVAESSTTDTARAATTQPDDATVVVELDDDAAAVIKSAVAQASGALAHAELVTTEGTAASADTIAQIQQTTSVVRELVRRVSTAAPDAVAASSPGTPGSDDVVAVASTATPSDDAGTTATATPSDDDATTPATATGAATQDAATSGASTAGTGPADAATSTGEPTTAPTTPTPTVDPVVGAAADAAVTAVAGGEAADQAPSAGTPAAGVVATALEQQAAALAELVGANPAVAVDVTPAPPTPEEIAAQQAAEAAAEAAHLAALAAEAMQYGNGAIPGHLLAEIPWSPGSKLRADATAQLTRLNEAFAARFGTNLGITDSYRSYADQVAVKQSRGRWAAVPGFSNHGFGVAVDLGTGIASFGSAEYQWMLENAPAFGWVNPDWAQQGGRKPEAWHWEFVG